MKVVFTAFVPLTSEVRAVTVFVLLLFLVVVVVVVVVVLKHVLSL